jgi:hypothetical protein
MGNSVVENYLVSLLSKPFVILTGNSGTGKTRMALRIAEKLEEKNYIVKTWLPIQIDRYGKIIDRTDNQIRDLCRESNVFIAKVNNLEIEVKIEMNIQIVCDDNHFNDLIKNNTTTEIYLGAAVRIPKEKRHVLVPVGADWTDTRNLLGYVNPFGPKGNTVYELTPVLLLILKALHPDNKYLPHFVILDEMNLSHVERYFSTFLSVMEANRSTINGNGISLIDRNELQIIIDTLNSNNNIDEKVLESANILLLQGKPVELPPNVFIIGTVNVDETTYMFSPKVLDRAHIIELETLHPSMYFKNNTPNFYQEDSLNADIILQHFQQSILYRENEYKGDNPINLLEKKWSEKNRFEEFKQELEIVLSGLYSILKTVNLDFGYRVYKETLEYLFFAISYYQNTHDWQQYVDNAILQKVLPKLHGNRRQLSEVLDVLIRFLDGEEIDENINGINIKVYAIKMDLSKSKEKLIRMRNTLENIGYVSFIS